MVLNAPATKTELKVTNPQNMISYNVKGYQLLSVISKNQKLLKVDNGNEMSNDTKCELTKLS